MKSSIFVHFILAFLSLSYAETYYVMNIFLKYKNMNLSIIIGFGWKKNMLCIPIKEWTNVLLTWLPTSADFVALW